MFIVKTVGATSRKWAMCPRAVVQDLNCLLVNDGRHIHISFLRQDDMPIAWTWLRYRDFRVMMNISSVCAEAPNLLRFRTYGHSGRICSVALKHSVEVIFGNEFFPRFDWQIYIPLFPNMPVLIRTVGKSVFASRVLLSGLEDTYKIKT